MKYLEPNLSFPAHQLAADEWLLNHTEESSLETLRIWESAEPFVVLGYSNRAAEEVNLAVCEERKMPVLRRVSGGGTVVQGPGCLSYSLTLRIDPAGPTGSVTATNRWIMERQRAAIEGLIGEPVRVQGHTDLECGGLKFSGNAQKRGRHALLFHGTLLHAADLELISSVLRHPSMEPDWRGGRPHRSFIGNLPATRQALAEAIRQAWDAGDLLDPAPLLAELPAWAERHESREWVFSR